MINFTLPEDRALAAHRQFAITSWQVDSDGSVTLQAQDLESVRRDRLAEDRPLSVRRPVYGEPGGRPAWLPALDSGARPAERNFALVLIGLQALVGLALVLALVVVFTGAVNG